MRIAIDIDGVLRDTFLKIEQIYQKFFIDELELVDDDFKYEIIEPYDTPNYENHFKFKMPHLKNLSQKSPMLLLEESWAKLHP